MPVVSIITFLQSLYSLVGCQFAWLVLKMHYAEVTLFCECAHQPATVPQLSHKCTHLAVIKKRLVSLFSHCSMIPDCVVWRTINQREEKEKKNI